MIDSIVFRIYDLKKHAQLVAFLHREGIDGNELRIKHFDQEDFSPVKQIKFQRYFIDQASGKTNPVMYRNHLRSYHYHIAYAISFMRDYIEFNFSMPKFLYGNNVMQLVPHFYDSSCQHFRGSNYFDIPGYHFMMFKRTLNYFFKTRFGELQPEKLEIEIINIDFCFNFVFPHQSDLEWYLGYIRGVKKKYQRSFSGKTKHYDTSIHYPCSTHTFKIYHKGPEFMVHDFNKIASQDLKNKQKTVKEVLEKGGDMVKPGKTDSQKKAEMLKSLAFRTLRYEVRFKGDGMSDIFWRSGKIKRDWFHLFSIYSNYVSKGYFRHQGKRWPIMVRKDGDLVAMPFPKEIKAMLDAGKKLYSKRLTFWLDVKNDIKKTPLKEFDHKVLFDYDFFALLLKKFHELSKPYYLSDTKRFVYLGKQVGIKVGNDLVTRDLKGHKKETVKFLAEMLKTKTWVEIQETGMFSRDTIRKYKKFFAQFGMNEVQTDASHLAEVDLTYGRYYDALYHIWDKVTNIKRLPFDL